MISRLLHIATPMLLWGITLLSPFTAWAADYNFCIRAYVQNHDSERVAVTGVTEDYYRSRTVKEYKARGIYVSVRDNLNQPIDSLYTDQNGCGTVSISGSGRSHLNPEQFRSHSPSVC